MKQFKIIETSKVIMKIKIKKNVITVYYLLVDKTVRHIVSRKMVVFKQYFRGYTNWQDLESLLDNRMTIVDFINKCYGEILITKLHDKVVYKKFNYDDFSRSLPISSKYLKNMVFICNFNKDEIREAILKEG